LNIILTNPPAPAYDFYHSEVRTKNVHAFLIFHMRAKCPAHSPGHVHSKEGWAQVQKSWVSSLCDILSIPVTSSYLGSDILLGALFWKTFNRCPTFRASDQVSHLYTIRRTNYRTVVQAVCGFRGGEINIRIHISDVRPGGLVEDTSIHFQGNVLSKRP
jgi:hypothetical protein